MSIRTASFTSSHENDTLTCTDYADFMVLLAAKRSCCRRQQPCRAAALLTA